MSLPTAFALGVRVWLKGLVRVMPLSVSSVLMLISLYAALLLSFAQNIEYQVVYDPFGIIYRPISYLLFLI